MDSLSSANQFVHDFGIHIGVVIAVGTIIWRAFEKRFCDGKRSAERSARINLLESKTTELQNNLQKAVDEISKIKENQHLLKESIQESISDVEKVVANLKGHLDHIIE